MRHDIVRRLRPSGGGAEGQCPTLYIKLRNARVFLCAARCDPVAHELFHLVLLLWLVLDVLMEARGGTPRGARRGKSSAKQLKRNEDEAVLILARQLNANCKGGDLFLTLKYSDSRLPATREEAKRIARNFMRRLARAYRKTTGKKLKWWLVTASVSTKTGQPVRLHHHVVTDAMDWELIAQHWPPEEFSYRRLDATGDYTAVARYMIRNAGYGGARAWSHSQGIRQPQYSTPIPVARAGTVRVPPEARVVEREIREDGETGFSAAYIRWVMPLEDNATRHGRRKRHDE